MVKSVLGVNHQGLTDWLIQRVSAVVMVFYSIGLLAYLVMNSPMDYTNWHLLFSHGWMKLATILFILCLLFHAWIGMWTVFTDYLTVRQMGPKANVVRLVVQVAMALALFVVIVWGIQIIWGN